MQVTVKKWGNSAAVRIPAEVMQSANLNLNEAVNIREEDGRIVIEPIQQKHYTLASLIEGITPDNQHGEISFGRPVGKEEF